MHLGWSRLGVTKALRYKENVTMVFSESLSSDGSFSRKFKSCRMEVLQLC